MAETTLFEFGEQLAYLLPKWFHLLFPHFSLKTSLKKALSLVLRNRALDDLTIIPSRLQLFKSTYDTVKIKNRLNN